MKIKDLKKFANIQKQIYTKKYGNDFDPNKLASDAMRNPQLFIVLNFNIALDDIRADDEHNFDIEVEELTLAKLRQLRSDTLTQLRFNGTTMKGIKDRDIEDALKLFLNEAKVYSLEMLKEQIAFTKEDETAFGKLLKAINNSDSNLEINLLKHQIWQVKRKIFNLPVRNHIMLIFYSKQGSGKSTLINKIIAPLESYVLRWNLPQIADERCQKILSENYIAFCDELAGAKKTEIDALKNTITASSLNPRKLGTNSNFKTRQSCTIIGASNKSINELIYDSGMRRFAQITCSGKMNWKVFDEIDFLNLWKSINHANEEGYLTSENLKELNCEQEELVSKDEIQCFLEELTIKPWTDGSTSKKYTIKNSDFYAVYSNWCSYNGFDRKKANSTNFYKRLTNKGFNMKSKFIKGTTLRATYLEVDDCSHHLLKQLVWVIS